VTVNINWTVEDLKIYLKSCISGLDDLIVTKIDLQSCSYT